MLLHIPPPSAATEVLSAALYVLAGFVVGLFTAYALFFRRKVQQPR